MAQVTKLNTQDRVINQLQDNFSKAINSILNNPLTNGYLLSNIELTTGSNKVSHKLGRNLTGWILTRVRSSATINETAADDKILTLNSTADVTVDLYVF